MTPSKEELEVMARECGYAKASETAQEYADFYPKGFHEDFSARILDWHTEQFRGLSDEELSTLATEEEFLLVCDGLEEFIEIARAVEVKLREKNMPKVEHDPADDTNVAMRSMVL